jgi:3-mercaptopyruvate sulfurtransferase SseA
MSTHYRASRWPRLGSLVGLFLLVTVGLAGCGGGEDNTVGYVSTPDGIVPIVINSPAQIAQESADNYDDNNNGLITGVTLKRWKDDWLIERPAGITGKLVILQVAAGATGSEYIMPNGMNVFTYDVGSDAWVTTRSNGVINTRSMVPDGASMDAILTKYNIDPHRDMIVVGMGTGGNFQAMVQGRIWYAFRYWGVEAKNLAILNGDNAWQVTSGAMAAGDFQATASSAPNSGIATVKSLPADNTALQATVEDLLNVLPASDTNVLNDGVFIWDARGMNQYSAGEDDGTGVPVVDYMTTFQNAGSSQGHPRGALELNYTNMLLAGEGYRYKDKADLEAYLDGNISGDGFVDATYQPVGVGNAYQPGDTVYTYCETTYRAMITGVTSAVILGKPTRFYDGAMVEWHSLSHLLDATGNYILPADSPWRTDVVSFSRPALDPSLVAQREIVDPYAAHANAIILADKAYKTSATDTGGGGGGAGGLPPNPCGG